MTEETNKPTGEKHDIATIRQISEIATVHNMERLIADLSASIRMTVAIRLMYPNFVMPYIEWTDDGVNGVSGFSVTREEPSKEA